MVKVPGYELSDHAADVIAQREIETTWVVRVLTNPERTEADRSDPTLTHALGRIEERDDRLLRVLYNASVAAHCYRLLRPPAARQDMRIRYDEKVDALYLRLDDSKVVESEEVKPGIVLDFNAKKQVVVIEVLDLKRRVPKADLRQLKVLVA